MNCVIIDDEPLAREGLANYVREIPFLQLVKTCENPVELTTLLDTLNIDLIFLDIQMPKMNGIDFLKIVQKLPMVIITTAYPTYALEGFQLNVMDYLLKPITFERFFKAVNKARDYYLLLNKNNAASPGKPVEETDYFFIKCGNKYERIYINDILYIEGMQNYVAIYTTKGKYITLQQLKNWEQHLDSRQFIRVHKSYIVAKNKIERIEGNDLFIQTYCIPISRNYREQVIEEVVNRKLYK